MPFTRLAADHLISCDRSRDAMTNRVVRARSRDAVRGTPPPPLQLASDDLSLCVSSHLPPPSLKDRRPSLSSPHRLLPGTDLRGTLLFSGTVRVPDPKSRFVAADRCSYASLERLKTVELNSIRNVDEKCNLLRQEFRSNGLTLRGPLWKRFRLVI